MEVLNPILAILPEDLRNRYNLPESTSKYLNPENYTDLMRDYAEAYIDQPIAQYSLNFSSPSMPSFEWLKMQHDIRSYVPYDEELLFSWSAGTGKELRSTGRQMLDMFFTPYGAMQATKLMETRESSGRIIATKDWNLPNSSEKASKNSSQDHLMKMLRIFQVQAQEIAKTIHGMADGMQQGENRYFHLP